MTLVEELRSWYDHPPLGWIQVAFFIEPVHWIFGTAGESIVTSGRRVIAGYMVVASLLDGEVDMVAGFRLFADLVGGVIGPRS